MQSGLWEFTGCLESQKGAIISAGKSENLGLTAFNIYEIKLSLIQVAG